MREKRECKNNRQSRDTGNTKHKTPNEENQSKTNIAQSYNDEQHETHQPIVNIRFVRDFVLLLFIAIVIVLKVVVLYSGCRLFVQLRLLPTHKNKMSCHLQTTICLGQ